MTFFVLQVGSKLCSFVVPVPTITVFECDFAASKIPSQDPTADILEKSWRKSEIYSIFYSHPVQNPKPQTSTF